MMNMTLISPKSVYGDYIRNILYKYDMNINVLREYNTPVILRRILKTVENPESNRINELILMRDGFTKVPAKLNTAEIKYMIDYLCTC